MDMNICSLNEYISNASVESYIEVAKICREIHAQILTIHPGLPNFLIESLRSHNKNQLIQSVIKLLDATVNTDTSICIENMPRKVNILNKEREIEEFLMNVNRQDLYITWDTSHSWTCDVNLNKFWEKFLHIIKNIHLVDNIDQDDDPHPALGTGKIDFNEIFSIFEKFNYDGPVIIELSSSKDLQTSLDFISNFL
jgi:sugar phosphate isomerase/epimerase